MLWPQVSEGWHGVRFDRPLARTREHVTVVSKGFVAIDGDLSGRALSATSAHCDPASRLLTIAPISEHIPIYLAAVGPKNLELAGELADGWLAIFYTPEFAPEQLSGCSPVGPGWVRTSTGSTSYPVSRLVVGADPRSMCRSSPWVRGPLYRRHGQS